MTTHRLAGAALAVSSLLGIALLGFFFLGHPIFGYVGLN